ncbi:MAG: methionine--tRNA ligase [Clostridiales bacterium]|nr:methionine--tRNA ligase [Clostridiales bacterium]
MKRKILLGGAWPYANYSLHVGHLAALLPGDVLARYFRQHGDEVIYVSGSDTHGTPITQRAKKEGTTPSAIAHKYHEEFVKAFKAMDFSYDLYTATFTDYHEEHVRQMLVDIYNNGYLYEKEKQQDYCETCGKFLADREITGLCPVCGKPAKGDQCDHCLTSFDPEDLKDKHCITCGNPTVQRPNHEMVFALSRFQNKLEDYYKKNSPAWRTNAVNETKKYLEQGLPDRDATRNLEWGIKVPFEGYEDKRIYVWFEAVMGYLTAGRKVAEERGIDFDEFMQDGDDLITYYIHGKDNIPFHTVIFPALIMALEKGWQCPKMIVSSEYVKLGEDKMSKSKGNLVSIQELADQFDPDSIRFFFTVNNPERRDISFSEGELIAAQNKFLCGAFGHLVNRNVSFLKKKFKGVVPAGTVDPEIEAQTQKMYDEIGAHLEAGELRAAAEQMIQYIQDANKYYDTQAPWTQVKAEDKTAFNNTTATCMYIIANMSNLLNPVLTRGCAKLRTMLELPETPTWSPINIKEGLVLGDCPILYQRLEVKEN